jgi:hypothetical protein
MDAAGGGEDFIGPGKVQYFNRIEYEDGDLKAHGAVRPGVAARRGASINIGQMIM